MKNLKPNVEYAEIFAMYWMCYCAIASFSSVFMLANGYSNTEIGILIAAGNLISVMVQPLAANIADRSRKINVFQLSALITLLIMGFGFFILILHGRNIILYLAYMFMLAFHASMQPLLNSMNATLLRRDTVVDYGICRSMGSLGYAIMSAALSFFVVRIGIAAIPSAAEISAFLLLAGLGLLNSVYKRAKPLQEPANDNAAKAKQEITMGDFIKRHKLFLVMTGGIFIIFYDHQIINFFMLQLFRNVGGGSTEMGVYYSIMTVLEIFPLFFFTWLCKRFSSSFLLKVATVGLVLRGVLMLMAHSSLMLMLTLVVHPIGFPLFLPAIVKYINEIMHEGEAVRGQSLYVMVITISGVVASFTGGMILDRFGADTLLWIGMITCFVGGGIILPLVEKVKNE